jgi:hypothetical protein
MVQTWKLLFRHESAKQEFQPNGPLSQNQFSTAFISNAEKSPIAHYFVNWGNI